MEPHTLHPWKQDLLLLICTGGVSAFLLSYRVWMSETFYFTFLVWNLFLAFVPLLLSWYLRPGQHWTVTVLMFVPWLFFLPNAPYLITDLIHLRVRGAVPLWFDAMLLFSFAFAGNWMGLRSLERWMKFLRLSTDSVYVVSGLFFLGALLGFGIFLGRILRFNTWDLITRPMVVLENAWHYIDDPRAVLMTCTFSVVLTCSYFVYAKMKEDYAAGFQQV